MMVICFIVITDSIHSQNMAGRVHDQLGNPISGVVVLFNENGIAETNAKGVFILPKSYTLPLKITLRHPEFYIRNVTLSTYHDVFLLMPLKQTQNLDAVMISSTYQKESQVIIPTAKISSKKLEEYSPVNMVSAINETPGVYIQSGALNTNRIVIRGVGSRTLYGTNKIRAYFNGIPITNGTGETAIDVFNPEDIANLEIVKGPKATPYGTNLGGTLLLNSKEVLPDETYINNSFTFGSFGLLKNSTTVATANEKLALNLNYDHLETDGFRDNSAYNKNAFVVSSNYNLSATNEIGILVNYINYVAQIPSSLGKTAFEEDPSQAAFTWKEAQGYEDNEQILVGLNYSHLFSESFSNTTSVFYNYLDHYEPRPFNILDENTAGYGARTLFAKDFKFLKNNSSFTFGGEFYKDHYNWKTLENLYEINNGNGSLEGQLLSDNKENRNTLNVFATAVFQLTEKLKAQIGINFNKTFYAYKDYFYTGENDKSADQNFDPIFAPNINILYQFSPNYNIYANVSSGFNYPSVEETLTPEGLINPDLGPETGTNYEIGSRMLLLNQKLKLQFAAYLLDIDNLIVADRVGDDQYIGRNAGKTEHKGFELSLVFTQNFNNGFSFIPYLNAEITDNRFVRFVDDNSDYSGNKLTGVPNNKMNGGMQCGYKNFYINANFLHVGDMPLDDANSLYSDPYTVFNTKLVYANKLTNHITLNINVGLNNFTDQTYASSILINAVGFGDSEPRYYYPGATRNWFAGFKIEYDI